MKISFHGAARSVTGSRHLIQAAGSRVLLDCGMFQGRRQEADQRNRDLGFEPKSVNAVLLSHAHLDHCGALPTLAKGGFSGKVHVTRAADDRNYYLTRANPLEQNIRIYRVVNGIRHLLQNFNHTIEMKKWHTLRVMTRGTNIKVFYDEKPAFNLTDQTFTTGRIGLWTKSDAVTYFDDLRLRILK